MSAGFATPPPIATTLFRLTHPGRKLRPVLVVLGRADAESSGINCEGNPAILERIGADRNPIE